MIGRLRPTVMFAVLIGWHGISCASAVSDNPNVMIERLVQCKASINDVVAFNAALESSEVTLVKADNYAPWGGLAWEMESPVFIGSVGSKIVLMNDRRSFYLRVPTSHPEKAIRALADQLQLTPALADVTHLDFRKPLEARTVQLLMGEEADSYWIGCFYDQDAIRQAQMALESASPAHIQKKQQLLRELNAQ